MKNIEFPKLSASDIECRVGTSNSNGSSLLLYKDARVDQRILDQVVGQFNWQREHYEVKGNLYCRVGIYDEDKNEWVWKADCGTESNTEKEKGEASDSFKRACFNWGLGRELYTAPFIWISIKKDDIYNHRFEVTEIGYDANGIINQLVIVDSKNNNKEVFRHGRHEDISKNVIKQSARPTAQPTPPPAPDILDIAKKMFDECMTMDAVKAVWDNPMFDEIRKSDSPKIAKFQEIKNEAKKRVDKPKPVEQCQQNDLFQN